MAYRDPNNNLHRSSDGQVIAGVCSGLSETFKIDVMIIRVIFLVLLFMGSVGFWLYVGLWIILPMYKD